MPQARFSYIMLEIRLRFSEHIFLNFYLFIFFIYLVRFKTNNKRFFLTCMLTRVFNLTTYLSFIIVLVLRCSSNSMFLSFNLTTSTMGGGGGMRGGHFPIKNFSYKKTRQKKAQGNSHQFILKKALLKNHWISLKMQGVSENASN